MQITDLKNDSTAKYLGDGVYATFDGTQIWLHTFDGYSVSNSIALDSEVYAGLIRYASIGHERAAHEPEKEA